MLPSQSREPCSAVSCLLLGAVQGRMLALGAGQQGCSQAVHVRGFWTMNSTWLSGAAQTGTGVLKDILGRI